MEKRTEAGRAAKQEYNRQYNRDNYDQIKIQVPKGGRELIKQQAANRNLSMTQYILSAIDEFEKK